MSEPSTQSLTREQLNKLNKPDLQKRCQNLGLTKIWVTKDKLVNMILDHSGISTATVIHNNIQPTSEVSSDVYSTSHNQSASLQSDDASLEMSVDTAPLTRQPNTVALAIHQSDADHHDNRQPNTAAHDIRQPDTDDYVNRQPDAALHDNRQPVADDHDNRQLDAIVHDTRQPDAASHDIRQLDAAAHDAHQPDTAAHDTRQPDAVAHDNRQLDAAAHDAHQPDAAAHDTRQPDTVAHDTRQPDAAAPVTCQPDPAAQATCQADVVLQPTVLLMLHLTSLLQVVPTQMILHTCGKESEVLTECSL